MTDSRTLVQVKGHPGIFKRGTSYVVRYRDPMGKDRKRLAKTLAQARAIKAEMKTDIERGEYRVNSRVTFKDYAETWRTTFTGRTGAGIRPYTRKRYLADLDNIILPAFQRYRMSEITTQDIKKFVQDLQAKGLSDSRVRNIYAPLRALIRTAVEENILRYDPSAGVRITSVRSVMDDDENTEKVIAYTDAELAKLLMATPKEWKLLVRFLAQTGLRISEAMALRWLDIDLGAKRIKVSRRLYKGTFDTPKTRYGRRQVPIADDLARELWNAKKTSGGGEDGPVFKNAQGGHLDYHNVYSRFLAPTQKKLGIATGAHVLRHTCATNLFKSGFNAKQVQVWMGHHSPAFTLATYVHLISDDLPEAPSLNLPVVKVDALGAENAKAS